MARESLFDILLRQPWWISTLVAAALFAGAHWIYPPVAFFVALPFLVVSAYIGYRQLRGTAGVNVDQKLAALREMSWENFSLVIAESYRRQGYAVTEAPESAYDFELAKGGRLTLLSCRRWKVNPVGVGPLRALAEAVARRDAYNAICITAGDFSPSARTYAQTKPLNLLDGAELVTVVSHVGKRRKWLVP